MKEVVPQLPSCGSFALDGVPFRLSDRLFLWEECVVKRYSLAPRVRIELIRDGGVRYRRQPVRSPRDVWQAMKEEAAVWERERFLVLGLDGRHRPIGLEEVSVGSVTACLVHPREVFKALLLANATAFILIHNHPSGDPTPSQEDRHITERLQKAGCLLGISLIDHVVVTDRAYYSFADQGELPSKPYQHASVPLTIP
jgi:DNA repair protein RadC